MVQIPENQEMGASELSPQQKKNENLLEAGDQAGSFA